MAGKHQSKSFSVSELTPSKVIFAVSVGWWWASGCMGSSHCV